MNIRKLNRRRLQFLAMAIIILVVVLVLLFPFYFIIVTSFKTRAEYYRGGIGLPDSPVLKHYVKIIVEFQFLRWISNSAILTFGSVFISLVLSSLTAYAIAKLSFPGRDLFLNSIIPLMIIPPVVMFIPLYVMLSRLNMLNNLLSLCIIYTGIQLPFSIFLLVSYYRTIPNQIISAATIDGCNHFGILTRIVAPLSRTAWITLGIVNALYVWNELLMALVFLQDERLKTLMVGITAFKGRFGVNVPTIMAGAVIAALPMVVLYFAGQKYFVRGLVAGALKS
jgi:ABC-type glycerol-3-phosphate transport system permease component